MNGRPDSFKVFRKNNWKNVWILYRLIILFVNNLDILRPKYAIFQSSNRCRALFFIRENYGVWSREWRSFCDVTPGDTLAMATLTFVAVELMQSSFRVYEATKWGNCAELNVNPWCLPKGNVAENWDKYEIDYCCVIWWKA